MTNSERPTLDRIVTCAAFGGFVLMALTSWVLAFDVASIASLTADSAKKDILAALIVGGALTKGAVIGAVIGAASLSWGSVKRHMARVRPSDAGS